MKPELTAQGVSVRTFDEVFTEISDSYKAIYGSDIDINQNTPDGQKIGILAKLVIDMESYGLALYSQFDPDFASGEVLNKIIKLAGITRSPATRSQSDVTLVTDRSLTLEAGFTVEDDNGLLWITDDLQSLVLGSNTVTLFSEDYGSIDAPAGTIISPATIVLGVVSVTNALPAIPGFDEETDEGLRARRNLSLENAAYSTVGSLYTKLSSVEGATDAVVYVNETDTYDATLDLNAHSIWAIVEGGSVADIIEVIAKNKTAGTGLKGLESGQYLEELVRPDGSAFNIIHEMIFDRPTTVPLFMTLTVTKKTATSVIDTALIKQKLSAVDFHINDNATVTELYFNVYSAGSNFVATDLQISIDDITYVGTKIDSGFDEIFSIDIANITIVEV
jgi:uncharacterized phage protein gp47/JayE